MRETDHGQVRTPEGGNLFAAHLLECGDPRGRPPKKKDSAEVYIGDEFIGVVSEDNEDGDKSYFFEMAILDTDLD